MIFGMDPTVRDIPGPDFVEAVDQLKIVLTSLPEADARIQDNPRFLNPSVECHVHADEQFALHLFHQISHT